MSDFQSISAEFKRMQTSLRSRVSSVLYVESQAIFNELQGRSPVDSGRFRSQWQMSSMRFSGNNVLSGYSFTNKTPYSSFMDEGAEVNAYPWYFPGSKKKTGKLKVSGGKVWAGGLNPGHAYTVGGQTGPVLLNNQKRINSLATKIADVIVGGM